MRNTQKSEFAFRYKYHSGPNGTFRITDVELIAEEPPIPGGDTVIHNRGTCAGLDTALEHLEVDHYGPWATSLEDQGEYLQVTAWAIPNPVRP